MKNYLALLFFIVAISGSCAQAPDNPSTTSAPEPDAGQAPLVVTKFWYPWLVPGYANCTFIVSYHSTAPDGIWMAGLFNRPFHPALFKVSLPDLQTAPLDIPDTQGVQFVCATPDALYIGHPENQPTASPPVCLSHLWRYVFATQTWSSKDFPNMLISHPGVVNGMLYLPFDSTGGGPGYHPESMESGVLKYDWDKDQQTLLASSRRRPGLSQFDDTARYMVMHTFTGPGNKPCLTSLMGVFGIYYIQETPGTWLPVLPKSGLYATIDAGTQTLLVSPFGAVFLVDPQKNDPIPLMEPRPHNQEGQPPPPASEPPPKDETLWDNPGRDFRGKVAYHDGCLYILERPKTPGGPYDLLVYRKDTGRTPRHVPLQFQLDDAAHDALSRMPGKMPNGWTLDEIEHPDTTPMPLDVISTNQGICFKLICAGFWFLPYSDIDAYGKSAAN